MHPSIHLSIYPIYPSIGLSICPPIHLLIYPSIHLSNPSIVPSIFLSLLLSFHLSIYPSVHLWVYPSMYLAIQLAIQLSSCPSFHLSMWEFLQKSTLIPVAPKQSNSSRLPPKKDSHSSKTNKFWETSSMFELDNIKNRRNFARHPQCFNLTTSKRRNSARLPQFSKLATSKTKQFCETSFRNE